MRATMHIDDVRDDVRANGSAAGGVAFDPGTVMLSSVDRHRQLDIVARRLVEAARARRRTICI